MVGAVGIERSIDPNRQESVRHAYPAPFARDWTEKEMDDELRENGSKLEIGKGGYNILEYIGFEMELSSRLARGQFIITERASQVGTEAHASEVSSSLQLKVKTVYRYALSKCLCLNLRKFGSFGWTSWFVWNFEEIFGLESFRFP